MSSMASMSGQLQRGEVTAHELVTQALARIEALNPKVNAFTDVLHTKALAQAAHVDEQRRQGLPLGPLAGVPFAVKNLFDIEGLVTRAGSTILADQPPATQDAVLVARLQEAGAVLVGALNMDEFAYGFTTENSHVGACHNPHDLSRISGGSSGGSGVAVAADLVPLTLGSDTNGSIRVPASLCGVWGLKPTFGRLSRRGTYPFVNSIDHLGPLANDVHGLAWAYDAMQGPDAADPGCHARGVQPVAAGMTQGVKGLRVGVLGGYFQENASAQAMDVVKQAASVLGATNLDVTWPEAALGRMAAFIISASEGGNLHLAHLRDQAAQMEPLSVDRFFAGALQPASWYVQAQRFRRVYRDRIQALFEQWDVLLAPSTPVVAPAIGTEWLEINGVRQPCRAAMGLLTQPISLMGCPSISAPMWPQGERLPLGVQLITAPWREDLGFRAAWTLAQAGAAHTKKAQGLS
jgi:amidase/aspartyl-tRNA(Asn)/glutamyl-tRNA(Gln) amidotransferase subunit A